MTLALKTKRLRSMLAEKFLVMLSPFLAALVAFNFAFFAPNLAPAMTCDEQFIKMAKIAKALSANEQKNFAKLRKDAAKYLATNLRLPEDQTAKQLELILQGNLPNLPKITAEDVIQGEPILAQSARGKIVSAYLKFVRSYQRLPEIKELSESLQLKETELSTLLGQGLLFDSYSSIREEAVAKNPRVFDRVVDSRFLDAAAIARTEQIVRESQTLLVTTAIPYTPVNQHMLASLKALAKQKNAKIVVMPAFMQTTGLDPLLLNDPDIHVLVNTTVLNPFLRLDNIKVMPKMLNPDAGLDQYGPRGQSVIIAAPQVRLKTVPTIDNDSFPHFVMSTGAITEPIYNTRLPIQGRTDALAADRHNLAVLLVEKSRGEQASSIPGATQTGIYHFRHIHYATGKGMVDKSTLYSPEGPRPARIEALVLPDVHVGMTDPRFMEGIADAVKALKPEYVVLHDVFNGHSISHHEAKNLLDSAINYKTGKLDLARELQDVATFINSLHHLSSKIEVRVILSNHDLWLNKWLNEGAFMKDAHNRALGIELAAAAERGQSPFEYALLKFGLEYPKRVNFVTNGSWTVAGVQLGQHGHQGANGARNSMLTMRRAADKSAFGHTHTTQIIGHTVNVGTGSLLRPGYNGTGPSSWSHSIAAVSELGVSQVFISQRGQWWTDKAIGNDPSFFPNGFPKIVPPTDPALGPQVDQYSHFER